MNVRAVMALNTPIHSDPWSVTISAQLPNRASTPCSKAQVVYLGSLAGMGSSTSSFEPASIIIITYFDPPSVVGNGPIRSRCHRYISPIRGKGFSVAVGLLNCALASPQTRQLPTTLPTSFMMPCHQYACRSR